MRGSTIEGRANKLGRSVQVMLGFSTVSVLFTLSHSIEDFHYNVPKERFGVDPLPASLLLAVGFALQVLAAALSAQNVRSGHWLNLLLGLVWVVAASLDHLGEILFAEPYRNGLASKGLELGVIVAAAIWAGSAASVLMSKNRTRGQALPSGEAKDEYPRDR